MARVVLTLALCAALVTACTGTSTPTRVAQPAQPTGKPVFITLQVEEHLNKYYQAISGGHSGAFAVSDKGTIGFYAYCQAVQCRDAVNFSGAALRGCEARAHAPCVLLAVGRQVRQPYMTYKEAEEKGLLAKANP